MSLTPAEQADIDRAAEEYEARQARLREERKPDRFTAQHAAWRRKLAQAGLAALDLDLGTQARRLLVGGAWHDGKWVLVNRPATLTTRDSAWWVDDYTRGVIPHELVQGWQLETPDTGAPDVFAAARVLRSQEPRPDCGGSLDVVQVQWEVGDTNTVEGDDGKLRTAYTASDEAWCHECEHMIPLAADTNPEQGDILVLVEHDRAGRTLI